MIARLKGIIGEIEDNALILDVGGVGYQVFCSSNTLRSCPGTGEATALFIETHIREDHFHLYGFSTKAEKESFLKLTKINGVGAKMGIAILSVLSPSDLATAIMSQDKAAFTAVSGVGPKLAGRLITELKDQFSLGIDTAPATASTGGTIQSAGNTHLQDAIAALVGLGYSRSDAYQVIHRLAAQNDNLPVEELIKQGLKSLTGG